jgi:hypothetical protein
MKPDAPSRPELRALGAHLAKHSANTAMLLALLAEFDRRKASASRSGAGRLFSPR